MLRSFLFALLGTSGLLVTALPQAAEHRFSGFATLGLASSTNPNLVFRRDVSQDDGSSDGAIEWQTDTLVGGQWHGRWNHQWDTTLQVVAKNRFNNDAEESIEWAFIGYRPVDGLDIRIGRMGADIFSLSDYRQVGYAYPWTRPPHDFYGLLPIFHLDGVDITQRFTWGATDLSIKGFYGNHDQQFPTGWRSADYTRLNFNTGGLSFTADYAHWKLRYTYATVAIKNDATRQLVGALNQASPYWPDATKWADMAATHERRFNYHSLGLHYDNNTWWLQTEFSRLQSQIGLITESDRLYASAGRRFEQLSLYLLAGRAKPNPALLSVTAPDNLPSPLAEQIEQLARITELSINGVRTSQSSMGLGIRWDFLPKRALKLQVEEFDIDAEGIHLWLRANSSQAIQSDQHSTVTSLTLDVLF